jgi:hypothetical protein
MERFLVMKSLRFFHVNRVMSTASKPETITIPLKWQKKMAKDLDERQKHDKLKKSYQGNTKVCF